MPEVDAMEFYQRVTDNESKSKQYTLEHETGAELTVDITEVDRSYVLDQINRLPDEMLDTLSEAEDEDEAQELAEEQNMLSNVDGETVLAFENLCAEAMDHDELTRHNFEDMVAELSFEVLFEMGSAVIELSLGDQGSIKDFREVDTDKNS